MFRDMPKPASFRQRDSMGGRSRRDPAMILPTLGETSMLRFVPALIVATAFAGCASTTPSVPVAPLELVDLAPVVLPLDCEPRRGVVYRTAFVVQPDGSVAQVAAQSGTGCVQQALQDWVATFRYRPVAEPTPTVIDWIAVTARRGG
jgi:hypothetical protein